MIFKAKAKGSPQGEGSRPRPQPSKQTKNLALTKITKNFHYIHIEHYTMPAIQVSPVTRRLELSRLRRNSKHKKLVLVVIKLF